MKKILEFLKDFVTKVFGTILDLFREHAELAVSITERLKNLVDSPVADVITALIPGDADNLIVAKLRLILPVVLEKVALANNITKEGKTQSEVIALVLKHLKKANIDSKKMFWVSFATELNIALSDGKIGFSEALILSQLVYSEIQKNKK
jgi:hypothetical protein